ncbi:hypothetical protein ACIBBE_42865 [Streptomyces sp. NPDC051644]|uniref:hypothetical protein n=1 Tax=Streptomyces sp. NPDC051644 TaxID=3365666 RepID=UPI003792B52C
MSNPTCHTPSLWAAGLTAQLDSLKDAAERARTAHDSASTASHSLTADVRLCEAAPGTVITYDGYARDHQTEVLREIAFAHRGLTMSVSRVWHRAAHAYAYAVSCLLIDLNAHGKDARLTAGHSVAVPAPPLHDAEACEAYRQAVTAQQAVVPSQQPYGALPWAHSADAWHRFAETADAQVRDMLMTLSESEPQTQSGR